MKADIKTKEKEAKLMEKYMNEFGDQNEQKNTEENKENGANEDVIGQVGKIQIVFSGFSFKIKIVCIIWKV